MPLFWFLAGSLTTLAALVVLLPRLRRMPRFETLPALPWQASAAAVLIVAATFGLHHWLGGEASAPPAAAAVTKVSEGSASAFSDATPAST